MKTSEVLKFGLEQIQRGWTIRAFARDANFQPVGLESPNTVCWCAVGALYQKIKNPYSEQLKEALSILDSVIREQNSTLSILHWNDQPGRTKEQVIAVYRAAIEKAEQKELS